MVGIGVKYVHQVSPISLHLWNGYFLPLDLAGLECDPHHVIFRYPFSNCTQKFLIVPILFWEIVSKECTIVVLAHPV